jgi:hypothetical protein
MPMKRCIRLGFTYFGEGLGDYIVQEYLGIGKKMQYVGENLGDYQAVIPLMASQFRAIDGIAIQLRTQ